MVSPTSGYSEMPEKYTLSIEANLRYTLPKARMKGTIDVGGKSMRAGALKPSTFKNPVGKKKDGEESYRLSKCQAARRRKGGMKEWCKLQNKKRQTLIRT